MGQQSTLQVGKVATTAFQQHQQHAQDIVEQSCYTASSSTATREYQMVVPFSAAHRLAGRGAAQGSSRGASRMPTAQGSTMSQHL